MAEIRTISSLSSQMPNYTVFVELRILVPLLNYSKGIMHSMLNVRSLCPPIVGIGPSWPSIEHGHSGITAHLETATFNVCETLNLGV